MKYLRLKAVSSCLGIRRSVVAYVSSSDDLKQSLEYPLNLIELCFNDNIEDIEFFKEKIKLTTGVPVSHSMVRTVAGLNKDEKEYDYFEILPLELVEDAIPFYSESIKNGYVFDEKAGEFEYIIGLIYEKIDSIKANEYFELAKKKNFSLADNKLNKSHTI